MNSLPRFVALALFVVLVALVALLAVPTWQDLRSDPPGASASDGATARAYQFSQRGARMLAGTAVTLTVVLIVSQTLQRRQEREIHAPFNAVRTETGALARLAQSSVAQAEELARERDVRRLAEDDVRLKQKLLEQSLEERIRLGHDLHDGIIQSLYAAGLTLETIRPLVKTDPDEAEQRLDRMRDGLNATIRDVRAYILGLAPEHLRRAGFARAMASQITELQAGRAAKLDVQIDKTAAAAFSPEQSLEFLQIAREAVSNAFRHGHATELTLHLDHDDAGFRLLVTDNGTGFDSNRRHQGGFGLVNMQVRAERIGATLTVSSRPGVGTQVLATLPVSASAAAS